MSLHSRIQVATTDPNEPEAHEDTDRTSVVADPFAQSMTTFNPERSRPSIDSMTESA